MLYLQVHIYNIDVNDLILKKYDNGLRSEYVTKRIIYGIYYFSVRKIV